MHILCMQGHRMLALLVHRVELLWVFTGAQHQSKNLPVRSLLHLQQLWELCSE